jgi:hypothetical protein
MKLLFISTFAIGALALLLVPASARDEQKKSAEQTKGKDEFIDYEALLNDKLGKGVTPEKNAVVLLWKALGPTPEGGDGMPPEFFKRLGISEPPRNGDYFISLNSYMRNNLKLAPEAFMGVWDKLDMTRKQPWDEKDYPQIAAWLKANEKPLTLVIEACNRPDYYNPLVSHGDGKSPGSLSGVLLPAVQKCRELAATLISRAMLYLFAGKSDAAWKDLLACHRLGRHVARGGTLIESLVGIAIDHMSSNSDLTFLQAAKLPSAKIRECLKDLEALPAMPSIAGKIDVTERLIYLQTMQMIRRGECKDFGFLGGPSEKLTGEESKAAAKEIDWEFAIENSKKWYDRIVATMQLKDRTARKKELDKLEKELEEVVKESKKAPKDDPGKAAAKSVSYVLISLLMPAFHKVASAHDRAQQIERNLHVAFALEVYKSEEGRYPTKLAELSPKYLTTVPDDLFSGKPLIYKPSDKGYLFYSVGANGKDDDGRWMDDEPPGDDLRVRMPISPVKK